MLIILLSGVLFLLLSAVGAQNAAPGDNSAFGREVSFAPKPGYSLTQREDTDHLDLTDGRLTEREDQSMWFESHAVGWSYQPVANLSVDLGSVQPIAEVAMRFLGGSPQPGIAFPGWVEVLVSDDGETYHRVATYSKWVPGDKEKYGIPPHEGQAWVHLIRFTGLATRGRYVGISFGGTGLTCSDELYVYRGDHDPADVTFSDENIVDFAVNRPQLAFFKPQLMVSNDIATPLPLGLLDESGVERDIDLEIIVPAGVEILAGGVGGNNFADDWTTTTLDGGRTRYSTSVTIRGASVVPWGRLWLRGALEHDALTELQYTMSWGEGQKTSTRTMQAITMRPAPRLERMMLAMGWYSLEGAKSWPDSLNVHRVIGLNTLSASGWPIEPDDTELLAFLDEAKQQGFKLVRIDSTWHRMMDRHRNDPEVKCQFADGTHGSLMCPSYRGHGYHEELQRIADQCALLKPDLLSTDVELWNWQGPVDSEKCTRCIADKEALGIADWQQWRYAKGYEMWKDLHDAVQAAVQAAGGSPVEVGSYDFRPGSYYQQFWPFDRLYADGLIHNSQVSTYTPLEPYHIALVGDEVRKDRALLPKSDQLPWLTPGDAGAFSAEALRCALLECFLNGARGIHFWSSRYWDTEYFWAFNMAVHAVAAAEDIIVDGELFDGARVEGRGRVSGMISGNEIALLVADYEAEGPVTVRLSLNLPVTCTVSDSESGEILDTLHAGDGRTLEVELTHHRSRVLIVRPVE